MKIKKAMLIKSIYRYDLFAEKDYLFGNGGDLRSYSRTE